MPPSVTSHLLLFHSPPSFSLTRRPPTPPLFPYTTLFRSRLRAQNLRCVLAAGDTFRAAAVQQLVVWGERVGCDVVRGKDGADPGSVVCDAIKKAQETRADFVLAGAAGRLHTKKHPMGEMQKIEKP